MAVLSLPLSFTNSFWSQDYRRGIEVLFNKLDQGILENAEILTFIRARANAENNLAIALTNPAPTGRAGSGFSADDGASLLMTFRGLQAESVVQGHVHKSISNELHTLVADPFEQWALNYNDRIKENRATVLGNWMKSYEAAYNEVSKLKQQYLAKTRRADDIEDDVKFSPNSGELTDKYTTSPRLRPVDRPQRSASVSERIAERLKVLQKTTTSTLHSSALAEDPSAASETETENKPSKIDKGKGKAVEDRPPSPAIASPQPMSPTLPPKAEIPPPTGLAPIMLAGLPFPPSAVSQLLLRAQAELPLKPVRFPLIGEYQDSFTGDEFVGWLNENVPSFGGNLDRAEDAARELTERDNLLRRLGELGNQFEHSDEAFYQFRPKAFELGKEADPKVSSPAKSMRTLQPENLRKQTATFTNFVTKALNAGQSEPAHVRARQEAEEADQTYRIAVRRLDRQRLRLEEGLEETLKTLQQWEVERLRAIKTVLLQYHGTVANLRKSLEQPLERSATLITAYQPESDLTALIERYRTGPFRPNPQIYESVAHNECDVVFGIDLRKWAEGGWDAISRGQEKKELIPPVITALFDGLTEAYKKLPDDEKRLSWIYEVPLPVVHRLSEALNAVPPEKPIPLDMVTKFDAPAIASTVKLWALELDPPLALYESWEEIRKLYRAKAEGQQTEEQHIQNLEAALLKLPRVHLYVLDAIVKHLKTLVDTTPVEESNEVYITKLALSVGRTFIRPKVESELSIQDRHPTLLFIDLLTNYDSILPPTIARKKRESERKIPTRKRTAPVDMRMSRSRISHIADAQQLYTAQKLAQHPSLPKKSSDVLSPPPPQSLVLPPAAEPMPPPIPAVVKPATPPLPPPPPVAEPDTQSTISVIAPSPPPPPPPPVVPLVPPPPPPAIMPPQPNRPSFKEPPPEPEDTPPRPMFKEPPPELDDVPNVPTGEPEAPSTSSLSPPPPPPAMVSPPPTPAVIPPTPQRSSMPKGSPSPTKFGSRSPTPPDDVILGSGKVSLSRNTSAQSSTSVRGPRFSRSPRMPSGGTVSSFVSNLNRNSVSGASPGTSPPKVGPMSSRTANRLSGSPAGRPSSVLGRSSAFSRRTMASDAEDEVVDK